MAQFEIFAERDGVLYGRVYLPDNGYWQPWTWLSDGTNTHGPCFDIEEIPATPQHNLKVDDLVWVWDIHKQDKRIACFAGFADNGIIETWCYGQTSIGCSAKNTWQNWEKYQPEPVQTSEPETPKWHEYLNQGYSVLCQIWDNQVDMENFFIDGVRRYSNDKYLSLGNVDWQHAEPIPTQCGKYCTAVKDGKTILLPLE